MADANHPVLKLVWDWLAAARELQSEAVEEDIDHAVEETFPASDPIATHIPKKRAQRMQQVNCVMSKGKLTLHWASDRVTKAEAAETGEPTTTMQTVDPNGEDLCVKVFVCD